MIKKINFLTVFGFVFTIANGQAPKYSNEFLSIGTGARALAMGNSQVAIANDVTAGFWNPAGLLHIKSDLQLGLMHSEYFAGIAKYDYGSFAKPVDENTAIGISLVRFGVDDIPNTTDILDANGNVNYDRITTFSVVDYAFLFSYAKRFNKIKMLEGLRYGVNAKVVHRKAGDFAKAWGFGLDFGVQYELKGWHLGIMGKDITTTFNAWSFNLSEEMKKTFADTDNELPENSLEITLPKFLFAAGRTFKLSEKFSLLASLDADVTSDGKRNVLIAAHTFSLDPHFGLEAGYKDLVFLRAGINNIQKVKDFDGTKSTIMQPSLGIGIRLKRITLDYALTNMGTKELLYSNVFSLRLDIFKKESEKQ